MEPLTVPVSFSPSKPYEDMPTRALGRVEGFSAGDSAVPLSRFGGWADRKVEATGFFRARKVGDRWWMVDPEGCLFLHVGVAGVRAQRTETAKAALAEKFGSQQGWAQATTAQLWQLGFNGTGAWSDDEALRRTDQPVAYTPIWNFMSTFAGKRGLTHTQPGHKGYANITYDPYTGLTDRMATLNAEVYALADHFDAEK